MPADSEAVRWAEFDIWRLRRISFKYADAQVAPMQCSAAQHRMLPKKAKCVS